MFDNPDFFPTPKAVALLMLAPYLGEPFEHESQGRYGSYKETLWRHVRLGAMTIIDPSAGSGTLLDHAIQALQERSSRHESYLKTEFQRRCYAIEQDPELVATLQGKGYRVIGTDFLEYQGDRQFDLILMNPPFSEGAAHLLKAWELCPAGSDVVCLLNSETINNAWTEERQLLAKIIEDYGSVQDLGQPFLEADAERKTDVGVSLVRLTRPDSAQDRFRFDFGSRTQAGPELTEDNLKDSVTRKDLVGNMMVRFDKVRESFVSFMRARDELSFYGADLRELVEHDDVHKIAVDALAATNSRRDAYNHFSDEVQQHLWRVVMGKLNIQQLLTHKIRTDFEKYSRSAGYMDFTKENVARLIETLMENRHSILEQAIVAVFDIFTSYHQENRLHVQGWKTNDKWKVNRKIILPRWVRWGEYCSKGQSDRFTLNWNYSSEYSDIDKALCHITGQRFDNLTGPGGKVIEYGIVTISRALDRRFDQLGYVGAGPFDGTCESTFFKLRFHKSGTLHLTFKDEKLWEEFNLRACAGKLWLPDHEEQAFRKRKRGPYDPPAAPDPEPQTSSPDQPTTLRLLGSSSPPAHCELDPDDFFTQLELASGALPIPQYDDEF